MAILENQNVYPFKYKKELRPYHDTLRWYNVPVYNSTDPNKDNKQISIEDAKRFNISEFPQLVGKDDWHDPSENTLNLLATGGLGMLRAAPAIASVLKPGTIGGNFIGQTAGYVGASTAANEVYKGVTGSNQGYMDDALDAVGIKNPVGRFAGYFADPLNWVNYGKTVPLLVLGVKNFSKNLNNQVIKFGNYKLTYTPQGTLSVGGLGELSGLKLTKLTDAEKAGIPRHDRTNKVPFLQGSTSSVPEDIMLINRARTPYLFENGRLVWNYIPSGVPRGRRITHHFSFDLPVTSHGSGSWDLAEHTIVVPYRHVVERNGQPLNVDIMDTYFGGFGRFTLDSDKVKILTADPRMYRRYKLQGIKTDYSPESALIIKQANNLKKQITPFEERIYNPDATGLTEEEVQQYLTLKQQLSDLLDLNYNLVSEWTSSVGRRPNMDDIRMIESESGLHTGATKKNPKSSTGTSEYIEYINNPGSHYVDFVRNIETQSMENSYRDPEWGIFAPLREALYELAKFRYPNLFDRLTYLRNKNNEVLNKDMSDLSKYGEPYNLVLNPNEVVTNFKDLGDELGIKVGQAYPGDNYVINLLNTLEKQYSKDTFGGDFIRALRKDNPKAVWKALNGTQWSLSPLSIGGLGELSGSKLTKLTDAEKLGIPKGENVTYSVNSNNKTPYYWDGVDFNTFNRKLLIQDMMEGRKELFDWIESPEYRVVAQANKAEAKAMGLEYIPTYDKPAYNLFKDKIAIRISDEVQGANGWYRRNNFDNAELNANIFINPNTNASARTVVRHEGAHASDHGHFDRTSNHSSKLKLLAYLRYKNSEVFDKDLSDLSKYGESYNFALNSDEAVANSRDLGNHLGIKVGQAYPGDNYVINLLNTVEKQLPKGTFRGDFIRALRKDNPKAVWKALNGTQWSLSPLLGLPFLNNNK